MQSLPVGSGTAIIIISVIVLSIYSWNVKNGVEKACYHGYHHKQHFVYPLVMNSFTHYNVLHLIINVLALAQIGYMLEKKIGAMHLMVLFAVETIIVNLLLTLFYAIYSAGCVVGVSGVLFALLTFWCYSISSSSLIFWCFPIRAIFVPWLTLVLVQLLFWRAAFWGHIIGIISGIATYYVWERMHWIHAETEGYTLNENTNVEAKRVPLT